MSTLKLKDFFDPDNPNIATGCGTTTKKCEYCDLELGTIGIYETHLNKVHEKPPMEYCDECATAFKRRMGLILHFRSTHMAPDGTYRKALGCDLCDAFLCINGFSTYDELVEHTENIHGKDVYINTPGNIGRSKCPLCNGEFTYRKGMIEHLQVVHGEHLISDMMKCTGDEKDRLCSDMRFKCRHCERIFTVRKTLVSHLEKIHKDFSGFKYGSATINTNVVYQGSYNERVGTSPKKNPARNRKSTLARYFGDNETIKQAENAGILPCPKCPQVFTRKNILKVHLRMSHQGEISADEQKEKSSTNKVESSVEEAEEEKLTSEEILDPIERPDLSVNERKRVRELSTNSIKVKLTPKRKYKKRKISNTPKIEDDEEDIVLGVESSRRGPKAKKRKVSNTPKITPKLEDDEEDIVIGAQLLEPKVEPPNPEPEPEVIEVETEEPDESQPFFSPKELEVWDAEDHQSFYPDSVPCVATADPKEELESCIDPKCDRKFLSYFSMMRHVAFAHYPARTAKAMKLKVLKKSQV